MLSIRLSSRCVLENVLFFKALFVQNEAGELTDMVSYYYLPSTVVSNPKHDDVKAVYAFYNVAVTVTWQQLMNDALIAAKKVCAIF